MWFLLPVAAALGYGVRLLVESTPKSEVVAYSSNSGVIDQAESAVKSAGIDYDVDTDGVNSWIMVKPDDRTKAVQAIKAVVSAGKMEQAGLPIF